MDLPRVSISSPDVLCAARVTPEERFGSMAGLVEELARTDAAGARPALAWLVHEQAPGAVYLD